MVATHARAQISSPLSADRPGQGTDAASVLSQGALQLEAGLFHEWDTNTDYSFWTYPGVLLRYGLIERVEVRMSSGLFTDQGRAGVGWSPVGVSTKVALVEQAQGWLPQAALLVALSLPRTGSEAVQSRFTEPSVTLLLNNSISSWLSITTNLGASWNSDSPAAVYFYAFSFDMVLSERVGAFAEFYGNLPENDTQTHLFDAGFTYAPGPNLQLDLAGGVGLTQAAPDFYLGGGVAVRWP